MEKLMSIVEYQSSTELRENRLRFFASKVKIWYYARISQAGYQILSLKNRSSLLRSYYSNLCVRFPETGNFFF